MPSPCIIQGGVLWIFDYLKIHNKSIHILYKQVHFGNYDTVCWEVWLANWLLDPTLGERR